MGIWLEIKRVCGGHLSFALIDANGTEEPKLRVCVCGGEFSVDISKTFRQERGQIRRVPAWGCVELLSQACSVFFPFLHPRLELSEPSRDEISAKGVRLSITRWNAGERWMMRWLARGLASSRAGDNLFNVFN